MKTSSRLIDACVLNTDELDHCLERTHLVFRGLVDQADRLLASFSLGRPHQRVLWILARQPGLPMGIIAQFLGVSTQALHKTMRDLAERNLIVSQADCVNRRLRRVSLTPAGEDLELQLTGPQRRVFQQVADKLGSDSIAQWGEVMDALALALGTKPKI